MTGAVDSRSQRAQLLGQVALSLTAWRLDAPILVAATAVMLGIGALWWPAGAVFVQLHERVVLPHLPRRAPVDGRPPRFSAALGGVTFGVLSLVLLTELRSVAWAVLVVNACVMLVEVVVGRCAPCEAFVWAARRGLVPSRAPVSDPLPHGLTLFTSPLCAACESMKVRLAAEAPSLSVNEISVFDRPDLVRLLDVRSTPSVFVVDDRGDIRAQASDEDQLAAALAATT